MIRLVSVLACTSIFLVQALSPGSVPPERFNRTQYSGVWIQHGHLDDVVEKGFIVGGDIALQWGEMEIEDGKWDWTIADQQIEKAVSQGYFVETALWTGDKAPSWLWKSAGVTKVKVLGEPGKPKAAGIFPYYLDPKYKTYFLRAIDTFAEHLASYPSHIRKRIVASQAMFGSSGDDCPWHGTPADSKFTIPVDVWDNFTMGISPAICKSYTKRGIRVLWNSNIDRLQQWINLCPGSFIKAGMVSHGFQLNYEADNYEGKGKICHAPGQHCRGESWPFMVSGYFDEAPIWATYWHLLWQLTFGVDMPGLSQPSLLNATYEPFYRLFNKYAASVRPPVTPETHAGAIIALRDGLDSNDTDRFPEAKFGTAVKGNQDRLLAIAKAFSSRGAAVGDPKAASADPMGSRKRQHMNDVGWRIWRGNYGNGLLTQLDPIASSIGWWRVGPKDQPYGRFARGFEYATNKTSMGFTLNRQLWGGLPLGHSLPLVIKVTHFDQGPGSFTVQYDGASGCKNAKSVEVGKTGRWVQTTVLVEDAHFDRSCGWGEHYKGADVVLHGEHGDVVFHGIEVFMERSGLPNVSQLVNVMV